MEALKKSKITVKVLVQAPVEKVWKYWTSPEHIVNWNNASDDWHTPKAAVDLRVGGTFTSTMAAKDGSMSFDFSGCYTKVEELKLIEYTLEDDRRVSIVFRGDEKQCEVQETFEAESTNSIELQQAGWQAILNNFKKYCESN
mgnify:FL=1